MSADSKLNVDNRMHVEETTSKLRAAAELNTVVGATTCLEAML